MQKSQEAESSTLISLSLLLGEDPEHLSQQLRATSLRDREPLGSPGLSKVGSEYLPFCTYEQPLAVEELAQLAEAGPGHEAGWSSRGSLFLEDSAPPSGFFPYYRSQEEHLASATTTPQGCSWCLGSRDPVPGSETQDGCHKVTARDGCLSLLAGPDLISGFPPSPVCCCCFRGHHVHEASGFVTYYRSPEERLRASPVVSSSVLGSSWE
uniref:Predicted gene 3045 n=1 Tax=Mus spicilegus TaxID=10103 RepID=A0A8C6HK93_MUSSI